MTRARRHQGGGMLGLLLTLLAVGALLWFALRSTRGPETAKAGNGSVESVRCEQRVSQLIAKTGGRGPDYKAGYDTLTPACRKLVPAPEALDPPPVRVEPES